jgi:hypothetical protein
VNLPRSGTTIIDTLQHFMLFSIAIASSRKMSVNQLAGKSSMGFRLSCILVIEITSVNYCWPFCTHMFVFPTSLPVCPYVEYLVSVFVERFGRPIMLILSIANSLCSDKPKRSSSLYYVYLVCASCFRASVLHAVLAYSILRPKLLGRS